MNIFRLPAKSPGVALFVLLLVAGISAGMIAVVQFAHDHHAAKIAQLVVSIVVASVVTLYVVCGFFVPIYNSIAKDDHSANFFSYMLALATKIIAFSSVYASMYIWNEHTFESLNASTLYGNWLYFLELASYLTLGTAAPCIVDTTAPLSGVLSGCDIFFSKFLEWGAVGVIAANYLLFVQKRNQRRAHKVHDGRKTVNPFHMIATSPFAAAFVFFVVLGIAVGMMCVVQFTNHHHTAKIFHLIVSIVVASLTLIYIVFGFFVPIYNDEIEDDYDANFFSYIFAIATKVIAMSMVYTTMYIWNPHTFEAVNASTLLGNWLYFVQMTSFISASTAAPCIVDTTLPLPAIISACDLYFSKVLEYSVIAVVIAVFIKQIHKNIAHRHPIKHQQHQQDASPSHSTHRRHVSTSLGDAYPQMDLNRVQA